MVRRRCLILVILLTPYASPGWGDTFILRDGGRIEGEWLNRDAKPLEVYEIELDSGGTLVVRADRVKEVVPQSPEKVEYRHWLTKMPATADGHWRMAQWCARHRLPDERLLHLQTAVSLAPDHKQARAALGYRFLDGEWVLADELMSARGFVKYKGRWRMPQDIALLESAEKEKELLAEWTRSIRRWQRWLGTEREPEALDQLLNLHDPIAAPVIIENLAEEDVPANRLLWIRVLGQLGTPSAVAALLHHSLADPRRENRTACLDQLESIHPAQVSAYYIQALASADNLRVRRAAVALRRLGDDSAIEPLINALVTQHRVVISVGDPNRTDAIFGSGSSSSGTGFSTGRRTKVEQQLFANREVLDALLERTGVNFQFDQDAWRKWYAARDLPDTMVNLRRDH